MVVLAAAVGGRRCAAKRDRPRGSSKAALGRRWPRARGRERSCDYNRRDPARRVCAAEGFFCLRGEKDRTGVGPVSRPIPINSRPRITVAAMKALLVTQPLKDCVPSKTLVELRSQTPAPIATRYKGRVVSATLRATATPTAPASSASSGYII